SVSNSYSNGLVSTERIEHPYMSEVKALFQDIKLTVKKVNENSVVAEVANRAYFTPTSDYVLQWAYVNEQGVEFQRGERVIDVAPNASETVLLDKLELGNAQGEFFLNFKWYPIEDKGLVSKKHVVAEDQYVYNVEKPIFEDLTKLKKSDALFEYDEAKGIMSNGRTIVTISQETGAITSFRHERNEFLKSPIELSFYRPVTDNDMRDDNSAKLWKEIGLESTYQKLNSISVVSKGKISTLDAKVTVYGKANEALFDADILYSFNYTGFVNIEVNLVPINENVKSLARIGWTMQMGKAYENIKYLGRNVESYPDRKQGGMVEIVKTKVNEMFYTYVNPQMTGDRADVRYVIISDTNEHSGLFVKAEQPFSFSYAPFEDSVIDDAMHINELSATLVNTLHIDYELQGVGNGSSDSDHIIKVEPKKFSFTFIPFVGVGLRNIEL
ncbi:MAG: beta-galactosidase domain 4-containing protein, partial [Rikenellaceae bacterium]